MKFVGKCFQNPLKSITIRSKIHQNPSKIDPQSEAEKKKNIEKNDAPDSVRLIQMGQKWSKMASKNHEKIDSEKVTQNDAQRIEKESKMEPTLLPKS